LKVAELAVHQKSSNKRQADNKRKRKENRMIQTPSPYVELPDVPTPKTGSVVASVLVKEVAVAVIRSFESIAKDGT